MNNPTSDSVRIYWWWRYSSENVRTVPPNTMARCFHFTASTWAQIEGAYGSAFGQGSTGGHYMTDAFDPVAQPHWQFDAHAEPRPTAPPYHYGFTVTNPTNGC